MLLYLTSSNEIDTSSLPPNITDMHVHTAGLGYGGSGCFISDTMRQSYKFDIYMEAFGTSAQELETEGDQLVMKKISQYVADSKYISKALVLALDGVVDEQGNLDRTKTEVYFPNDFVGQEALKYPNLLFGASINPNRHDWRDRLEKAVQMEAKLIKWIPSIQGIDPADPKVIPFYQELVRLNLPLLSHTGSEKSFTHARDELADPIRLKLPLSLGVKVIAAHVATTGENEGIPDIQRLLQIVDKYPNLYADISSLTQINKYFFWDDVFREQTLNDRLLYGSDFPLSNTILVSPIHRVLHIPPGKIRAILREQNPFDRDVLYKLAMGVSPDIFSRFDRVIQE